jgi:hypothetical protein
MRKIKYICSYCQKEIKPKDLWNHMVQKHKNKEPKYYAIENFYDKEKK